MKEFLKKCLTNFFLFWFRHLPLYRAYTLLALQKYIAGNKEGKQHFFAVFKTNINQAMLDEPYLFFSGYIHIERTIAIAHFLKIPTQSLIIDVGGFDGKVAVKFAEAFPEAQIYTFEPIRKHFDNLQNTIRSYPSITSFNVALGDSTEEKQINQLHNDSSSSILAAADLIENHFFATHLAPKGTENIFIKRLDDILSANTAHISILKIDVQGFELNVLKGSINTLKKVYIIVLEMQNHDFYKEAPMYFELDAYLRSQGFELFDLLPAIRNDMKLYEWDAIYVNAALLSGSV
jgi:FkbM family methyltransferase